MKNFVLREMLLASFRTKTARRVVFDPNVTIVKGNNETGKSSLIKSILRTFGAEPAKVHPSWDQAEVRSVVRFEIDGKQYAMLRHGGTYAMFDAEARRLQNFSSVTNELGPFFANLVGFGLRLPGRSGVLGPLPPAFYFLPFYMDQDASWSDAWAGFKNLDQFPNWKQSVIEYHAGIRGNEFYAEKAKKIEAESELNRVRRKREGLQEIYGNLQDRFDMAQFNVNFEAYGAEVEELLRKCSKLRQREEQFKVDLSELRNQREALKTQIGITTHARNESRQDFDFAVQLGSASEEIHCPTCGQGYTNSFGERFDIARDEDRCADLALQLTGELADVDSKINVKLADMRKIGDDVTMIERLLGRKEGEVALVDLVRQEGRRELRDVMDRDWVH